MAMDQSALLEMLTALKAADVGDRIRQATEKLYQELIDAEATAVIGAGDPPPLLGPCDGDPGKWTAVTRFGDGSY